MDMKRIAIAFVGLTIVGLLLVQPQQAGAQNHPPPSPPPGGSIIFDPGATPGVTALPTTYTLYSTTFTATLALTDITFAFRHDPGYFAMDNVSVTPGPGFVNGGFETGDLTGWTYDNMYGVSFAGVVSNGCHGLPNFAGSFVWCDGATQGYDAIDQKVATVIGTTYTVSFWLDQFDSTGFSTGFFQDLSTNGNPGTDGNATGVLVYVGGAAPPPIPEPGTLVLLGSGILGLATVARRKMRL
jgi:PEP-CTERM motif